MSKAKRAVREASKQPEGVLAEQAKLALQAQGLGSSVQAINIGKALRTEVMDLLEENIRDLYVASSMGWNRREKQRELFDKASKFMVIKDSQNHLAAFLNWRFDCEECDEDDPQIRPDEEILEVLYCYEVQIKSDHRSKKLGKLLMDMLHSIAKHSRMKKVMLTVFLSNQVARSFYSKIGYSSDLISPIIVENGTSTADYDIMSLAIVI